MIENLVIVESPAKAKTIERFLGSNYTVKSSFGHIRDLEKKDLGIDIENNFQPKYEISADKKAVVKELKALAKEAKTVWLASDEDREGEAIAWHLFEALKLKPENTKRIVFHEITKDAILHAIQNPRNIDRNLVNAQQARRVLDRLVGFEVSPVLWKKVKPSLSAGRVQSVAVKLIVEREREINAFKEQQYYKVNGIFETAAEQAEFKADVEERFDTKEHTLEFLEICKKAQFTVSQVETKPSVRKPSPPFTTSTLQQEASRKLGFSVSQTMAVAQKLYERGYITYMRTDSVNLSDLAIRSAKAVICQTLGERYSKSRQFTTQSKGAQEAHEAIRPTYMDKTAIEGDRNEQALYELIYKRMLASQMADAELEKTNITIRVSGSEIPFMASGEVVIFDGFLRMYRESHDDEHDDGSAAHLAEDVLEGDLGTGLAAGHHDLGLHSTGQAHVVDDVHDGDDDRTDQQSAGHILGILQLGADGGGADPALEREGQGHDSAEQALGEGHLGDDVGEVELGHAAGQTHDGADNGHQQQGDELDDGGADLELTGQLGSQSIHGVGDNHENTGHRPQRPPSPSARRSSGRAASSARTPGRGSR